MIKAERARAYTLLFALIAKKTPLQFTATADNPVSPLTKIICFGVCRHYFRLKVIMDLLVAKRPTEDIEVVLLMGLYQLLFLDKPEYVTVKETVDLVIFIKKPWAKGLVNAVLRRFCRERDAIITECASAIPYQTEHSSWFVERITQEWPLEKEAILTANNTHPPMTLRVNERHLTRDAYLSLLQERGIVATPTLYSPVGVILSQPTSVDVLPGFLEGHVSIQDEAAQLAVSLLPLESGLRVLDACCAPGGKTCHMLESEPQLKQVIALDNDATRLPRVRENIARLNLSAMVVHGDGCVPETWWDGELFDRILLDAPCSALGVIRRHPDIKLLRNPEDIDDLAKTQAALLHSLWPLLRPGGFFLYATCSIIKQENEKQIQAFLAEYKDAVLVVIDKPWGHWTDYGLQVLPGDFNTDGFFYCLLTKK